VTLAVPWRQVAEHDPTWKHDPKRGEGLRHPGGVIAKGGCEYARADSDPRCKRPEGAEPCEREGSMAAVMLPRLEMVADKDRVKTWLLTGARDCSNSDGPNCSADALYPSLSTVRRRRHGPRGPRP
jgi:hypothetical protein